VPVADLLVHGGEPMSADRLVEDPWNGDAVSEPDIRVLTGG
jgi:hypothetical protein